MPIPTSSSERESRGDRGTSPSADAPLDVAELRAEFPILSREVHGKPLVYLDNGATTQKPRRVIDAITRYYEEDNANIHRGVHYLSQRSTQLFEDARAEVRDFLGAARAEEIVFVRGTTEAVNLVAQSYLRQELRPGDEVLVTHMEHHSGIVPYQMVCEQTGAVLRVAPVDDDGQLDMEQLLGLLGPRTRFVSLVHVSNALGTINPVREICAAAHDVGAKVLVDGAQAVAHLPVDVTELDCDFYAFSGHKLYGPTGIGVLWGRHELLESMTPYQGGGDMILSVTFEETKFNKVPHKFEAGTPHVAGVIGLGEAIRWVGEQGLTRIARHEDAVLRHGTERLEAIDGLRVIGRAKEKAGILGFVFDDVHPHDIGTILDQEGIAVRAGHHCAQPIMERFGVSSTVRASIAAYNTTEEMDRLAAALVKVREVFC